MNARYGGLWGVGLLLSGCSIDLVNALGGGSTVTGSVEMPQAQTAAYRVLALVNGGNEQPVKNASVQAMTPAGSAFGPVVTTDSLGRYELKGVPLSKTTMIVASIAVGGRTLQASGLVRPTGVSAGRELNVASSIVAQKLRALPAARLEAISQIDLDTLEGMVAASLKASDVPPLDDSNRVLVAFDTAMKANTELATSYNRMAGLTTASLR